MGAGWGHTWAVATVSGWAVGREVKRAELMGLAPVTQRVPGRARVWAAGKVLDSVEWRVAETAAQ